MDRKQYEWEKNFYGKTMMEHFDHLKDAVNGIESVKDLVAKYYKLESCLDSIKAYREIYRYLIDIEHEFPKEDKE